MRETDKFVFFWGDEDVYSNFFYAPFKHKGIVFKWSEQAIMWRKAKLFGAHKIAEQILKADAPIKCKNLGRSRQIPFNEDVWVENRCKVYQEVLMDKFSLPHLKKEILATGDKHLVEASPFDAIWGIKMGENHRHVENPDKWRGLNLLGEVLMKVRKELKTS